MTIPPSRWASRARARAPIISSPSSAPTTTAPRRRRIVPSRWRNTIRPIQIPVSIPIPIPIPTRITSTASTTTSTTTRPRRGGIRISSPVTTAPPKPRSSPKLPPTSITFPCRTTPSTSRPPSCSCGSVRSTSTRALDAQLRRKRHIFWEEHRNEQEIPRYESQLLQVPFVSVPLPHCLTPGWLCVQQQAWCRNIQRTWLPKDVARVHHPYVLLGETALIGGVCVYGPEGEPCQGVFVFCYVGRSVS